MTRFQKVVLSLMPKAWAQAAEAESKTWVLTCGACKHAQSIWDAGGIRWGGSGRPLTYRRCRSCKKLGWQQVVRRKG